MLQTNNNNFHNGLYIYGKEFSESILKKISNPFLTDKLFYADCTYYDASIFINGICNIFAFALYKKFKKFKYEICKIVDYTGRDLHWFCISYYKGKKVYIDVRGATTDYEEFAWQFHSSKDPIPEVVEYKNIDILDFEDEYGEIGLKFANAIIEKQKEYYLFN